MLIIFDRFAYNIFHRGVDASQANLLKRHAFIKTKVNILLSFAALSQRIYISLFLQGEGG